MSLLVSELVTAMKAQLGAEGTQRYTLNQDFIPAINGAARRFEALMGSVLAEKKGSEESFRELTRTVIYQTNAQGGFWLDDPRNPDQIWTVLALFAEPQVTSGTYAILSLEPYESAFRTDLAFAGSAKRVKRITPELAAETTNNMALSGNERLAANASLRTYAYYIVGDRSTSTGNNQWQTTGQPEFQVIPKSQTSRAIVGVSYLRCAPPVVSATDTLPYPQSLFTIIRDLALNEVAVKQGDGTTLYTITEKEILRMLNAQS